MDLLIFDVIILVGLLVLGVPIPFCFMAVVVSRSLVHGYSWDFLLPVGFYKINSIVLLSIPMFIILGSLLNATGIAVRLIDMANAATGRFRGGLGAVSVVACAMVGAIAGTCSAAVAAVGSVMIPRMEKDGYSRGYSSALISCASVLGQLIPPSVPQVLYAWVTLQSVAACFLSTVGPGILLVIIYSFINYLYARKMQVKVVPAEKFTKWMGEIGKTVRRGSAGLLIPVTVLGSIFGGLTTPTEAATLGVLITAIIGFFIYREMSFRTFVRTLVEAGVTTGVVVAMVFFVMILSRIYVMENIPQQLIELIKGVSENKYIILLLVNLFLIAVGMLMDDFSGTLMATPLLYPLMLSIGVHPIHFAAILGTNLGMGNMTVPCAPILYLGCRIGHTTIDKVLVPSTVYLLFGSLPVVLITTYWPDLSLFLPRLILEIK
ncbi:MAG: TRAP transporter large permease [Thermodesulfobacteriota bacterium]|jgi:tripartite ATP-independent transporter DctM subunit